MSDLHKFLFIGDSLIEFFNWQERFPGKHILNYGIAGETAEGLLSRLPAVINRVPAPELVLIMTGINNVAMEDYGFLVSYEKIISLLQEAYGKTTIVISSLLPADLFFLGDAVPRVNKRLLAIAKKNNILYLDLYPLFIDKNSRIIPSYFESDGVHLSAAGYEVWARTLEKTIFPLLD
ncbi:MAG: GDSL family lipase [Deltaproteobacteria bacterium]|jgi:lysophospholipase L1-like esterase|nr:GDSL family lipase [Deltaproteobacteria bacterium]